MSMISSSVGSVPVTRLERLKKLNGIVPTTDHITTWMEVVRSLYGRVLTKQTFISMGDKPLLGRNASMTGTSRQVVFAIPVTMGAEYVQIDVIGYATSYGVKSLKFQSTNGSDTALLGLDNYSPTTGAPSGWSAADSPDSGSLHSISTIWSAGSERYATSVTTAEKALKVSPDSKGFETITYTEVDGVYVMGLQFTELWREHNDTTNSGYFTPALSSL